jgi:hypothetical protein
MKLLKQLFILLIIAASATYVGFQFRMSRHARAMADAQRQSARPETQKNTPRKKGKELPPASPLVKKLENDIAMSKGVTRWLTWLETLEKAEASDFPRLFDLAQNNPDLMKLVATRWAEKFPRHFFDTVLARFGNGTDTPWEALDILFSTWAKNDPNGLIAALDAGSDFGGRTSWRMQAINTLTKNDVETGLRLMSQWHIENYTPDLKNVPKWAAADPVHAAEYTLQNRAGNVTGQTLQIIAREWAKTDPAAALAFARSSGGIYKGTMSSAALSQWAEQDLKKAGEWLVSADSSTRNELSPNFVQTWSKSDFASALEWSQANLSGSTLARSVGNAINSVADKDPSIAASFVLDMQPSSARAEAAGAVASKWFPDTFSNGGENKPPAEAVQWLSKLDPESAKRAIGDVHWKWEDTDPKGMAAFLEHTDNDQLPDYLYQNLARTMARKDPTEALDWTGRLPEKIRGPASEYAFREWRQTQPEAAADWLAKLSPDDSRRARLFENTIREWAPEEQKTDQLARFTAINEKAAESLLKEIPLPDERRATLLASLPSRRLGGK